MIQKKCPDCGDDQFFVNREKGEVICKTCSFVLDDSMVDFGRERSIDSEDLQKNSRSGAPFDPRIANNIITDVGNNQDLRKLPKNTQMLMKRIRKKNRWTSSGLENNLNTAMANLKIISSFLKLPENVEKEAARIYRVSAEHGFTRARSCESTIVAALYASCKIYSVPKTLKEFSTASKINKKQIGKTYRLLLRSQKLKINPSSPVEYINRFGSELGLTAKTQTKAIKIIEMAQKKDLISGCSPLSIAAASLYISAIMNKEKRKQKEVTDVTGITEVTLRNRCREMKESLGLKVEIRKVEIKKK